MRQSLGSAAAALAALLVSLIATAAPGAPLGPQTLVVGWNDEFNSFTNWRAFPMPNMPDISMPKRGTLRLGLGKGVERTPADFYWATAWRIADVDTERYPILAVYARNLRGPGWWDVVLQEQRERRLIGKEFKTPSLDHSGLILFELPPPLRETESSTRSDSPALPVKSGPRQIRVRINVAGTKQGCSVDYAWLRFIRREDLDKVRANPLIQSIIVEP